MLLLSSVWLFATPWTVAHQALLSLQARILEWVAIPSSGDLLDPGLEPRAPALQANSLPAEQPRKPKNTGVGSLPLLQGNFLTQELSQGLHLAGDFLYQMSYWGSPCIRLYTTYFIYCLSSLDNNGKTIPNFLNKVINTLSGTQSTL